MEIIDSLDPTTAALLIGAISGAIELIKRSIEGDIHAVIIIAGAGLAGFLSALALSVNPIAGIVTGFAASGYITIAQNIGKK